MATFRNIVAGVRIGAFLLITLSGTVVYLATWPLGPPVRGFITKHWWASGCCRAFGLDCKLSGKIDPHAPCLWVSNHLSYLDIVALGSSVEVSFAAKAEMKTWPFFGTLTRLTDTIFISRNPRHAKEVLAQISERLRSGRNLILFPEGTSWDGSEIRPFKSSAFSIVDDEELRTKLRVQPLSIAYIPKKAPDQRAPTPFAWCKGYPLWQHIWESAGRGGAEVRIVAYEPVCLGDFANRKELANYCFDAIEHGYFRSIERPVRKYDPASDPTLTRSANNA